MEISEGGRKVRNQYYKAKRDSLTPEQKEKRNAYQREYRKKHPEKVREAMARYWDKKFKEFHERERERERNNTNINGDGQ